MGRCRRKVLRDGHQDGCPVSHEQHRRLRQGRGLEWPDRRDREPSGAEETKLYADDIKYASLRSAEEYGYTIEAYTYPTEWEPCDGSAQVATGVSIGQQKRQGFGFSWVTTVGNDVDDEVGQKIHIAWNSTASPSEKSYATINDNPDAITFSWECTTSP